MSPIGDALGMTETNKFDFFGPVEKAWRKVKFFSLKRQLGGQQYWFQDTDLSSHRSLRKKNCPCCDKCCTPEVKCCQRCYRHAQLASSTVGEAQSVLTSGGSPNPDSEELTYNGDMDKCIPCGKFWPEQTLDKNRLCGECRESFNQSQRK